MITNPNRMFRFTSSNIWKLCQIGRGEYGFGEKALTYIEEVRASRCLGRSIDTGTHGQAVTWGKVAEYYCDKFHLSDGVEYELCSDESVKHPEYDFWAGSQDAKTETKAVEIKCFYPKAFFGITQDMILYNSDKITLDEFIVRQKEVFWQVVSNSILLGLPESEIIAYTPTESQLMQIRKEIENSDGKTSVTELLNLNPWQTRFIYESPIHELPYIPEGIDYPNIVKMSFSLREQDKTLLTKNVINANEILTRTEL